LEDFIYTINNTIWALPCHNFYFNQTRRIL